MNAFVVAFRNMRRSPYQALTATLMMSLTFFLLYCFSILLYGADTALRYLETRPQVTAFFSVTATPEQVEDAKVALESKDYVSGVKVVTKDEALIAFREQNKDDPLIIELVTAEILPASLEIRAKDISNLEQVRDDITSQPGIDEVMYQQDVVSNLRFWTSNIRIAGLSLVGFLLVTTILFISVILSLRIAMKRGEIAIMNLLGAGAWYIRGPFLAEGMIYGVVGSIFGAMGCLILLLYTSPSVVRFFGPMWSAPLSPLYILALFGAGTGIGMMVGLLSSFLAVKRLVRH